MQDSLKRKLLAGGIAGALVLGVGAVAGAATGVIVDHGPPEVGHHSGTEAEHTGTNAEHGTEVEDSTTTTTLDPALPPAPAPGSVGSDDPVGHDANDATDDNGVDAPGHDANDDNGVDAPGHDANDDNGVDAPGHDGTEDGGSGSSGSNRGSGSDG